LVSSFAFVSNTTYAFQVWTYNPNNTSDSYTGNDTIKLVYKHVGVPAIPSAGRVSTCGYGKVDISAASTDSIAWFDEDIDGNLLGFGAKYTTPYLTQTDTFYAEAIKFKHQNTEFGTGFYNYTTLSNDASAYNGGMLKVSVKELVKISGLKVQSVFGNTTPHYKVYVRKGGFAGYERDSGTWSRIFDAELSNGSQYNTIPLEIVLQPGIDYGFYITTDPANGEDIWMNYGTYAYSNADLTVEGGAAVYGKFGSIGVYTPWTLDMQFIYEKTCRSNARQAVEVLVNPKPFGSEWIAGAGFKGQYNLGLAAQPDIGEPGVQLQYELTPPTAYTNSEYKKTWTIDSLSLQTTYGQPVNPSLFKFVSPDSSGNGMLLFTPDSSVLDSTIAIRIRCKDLGPYFCDTVISRFVHIAPVPQPLFKVVSTICEGSEVYFNNLSHIHSGGMTYKWYFSNTDSSDVFEPIHFFDSFGVYPVKLVVTSLPYHIRRDTIILVNINGVPKVNFKVENACQGQAISLKNTTAGNLSLINFKWDFGDRTPMSNLVNPVHIYNVPDMYRVTLKAELNGCSDTVIKNAYLFSRPLVNFTAPAEAKCQDEDLFFVNHSTIYQGKMGAFWDFSDSNYSTLFNTEHRFSEAGTYQVTLKMVSEFDCIDSLSKLVIVKKTPEPGFVYDKLCSNDSTHFKNVSPEYAGLQALYTWNFGEGPIQTSRNVSKKWNSPGPKVVKLKSELSNACQAESEVSLNVLIQADANFNVKDICSGESAVFVNLSKIQQGQMSFLWNFGDTTPSTDIANPKHVYAVDTARYFTVMLIADATDGCKDTVKKAIKVTELPDCNFTYAPFNLIGNKSFKFIPANNYYTEYEWFFGEGGTSTSKSPIYQFLYNGHYDVRLRAKNAGGCECEQLIQINVDLTGLETVYTQIFDLYPNPANQSFVIRMKVGDGSGIINLYNHLGQLVLSRDLSFVNDINTADLSSGLYVVEVVTDGKSVQARLDIIH